MSNRERRSRVLRLGYKIQEIVTLSIHSGEAEARFHMKAFPKKAGILCEDIAVLFEEAIRGTILDRSMSMVERQTSTRKLKDDVRVRRRKSKQSSEPRELRAACMKPTRRKCRTSAVTKSG